VSFDIDHRVARDRLDGALALAKAEGPLPDEWTNRTRQVGRASSKTNVAVLGTILLAKATDDRVDVFSLKKDSRESPSAGAYGPRMLAHEVLVPFAVDHGIHLGATGREPWNNQPWFRYDVADMTMRVRNRDDHRYLLDCFDAAAKLDREKALLALAAFLRERSERKVAESGVRLGPQIPPLVAVIRALEAHVIASEGGKRGQALSAAALDLVFDNVHTGAINDPSRHWPGDVQVFFDEAVPFLCCEVRQKEVNRTDALLFCRAVGKAKVGRALMALLAPEQPPLDQLQLASEAEERFGVQLSLVVGSGPLIRQVAAWGRFPFPDLTPALIDRYQTRLEELEVGEEALTTLQAALEALST